MKTRVCGELRARNEVDGEISSKIARYNAFVDFAVRNSLDDDDDDDDDEQCIVNKW